MDINCPDCGHNIDSHIARRCSTPEGSRCACEAFPSDIARALLTAEPTEARVSAVRVELDDSDFEQGSYHDVTRAVLRAAAKVA